MSLSEHPAVRAWARLTASDSVPEEVHPVLRTWRKPKKNPKPIFHLEGLETTDHPVIAKLCSQDAALRELAVYRGILPQVPTHSPKLIGSTPDDEGSGEWLFLEYIQGTAYDPGVDLHRRLAGECLGILHTTARRATGASHLARLGYLYDTSPEGIYRYLRTTLDLLPEVVSNPKLNREDRDVLARITTQCRVVQNGWPVMNDFCHANPRTLVHGDLLAPNLRVRHNGGRPSVVVFDFERSGWGVPAFDLTRFLGSELNPDLEAYLDVVRRYRPTLDVKTIRRLAYVGEVFRWLEAVRWEVEGLRWEWVEKPMNRLRTYHLWMNDIGHAAPWLDNPALAEGDWRSFLPSNC